MDNQPGISKIENFLSFYLTPQHQALLSTRQLAEIINLDATEIVPIPEMPSAVAGVCSWQGNVLWLVDLSYWSGSDPLLTSALTSSNCNVLKVRCQGGTLGLLVHQVGQLKSCEVQEIQSITDSLAPSGLKGKAGTPLSPQMLPIRQECIKGIWINPSGEPLPILDLDTVVQHLVQ